MEGYPLVIGILIGVLLTMILSGIFNMNGFHFGDEIEYPLLELENGTLIQCIECEKMIKK